MDLQRILEVLTICVPVFALIGLGKLFQRRGILTDDRCQFINWLVFYFSLPALIFPEVAKQKPEAFLNTALILVPLAAILPLLGVYALVGRARNYKHQAAVLFGIFWANTAYIGFPITQNAFSHNGMALAAIYNAAVLPVFLTTAFLLIGAFGGNAGDSLWQRVRAALLSPPVLAALLGLAAAILAEFFRTNGVLQLPLGAERFLPIISGIMTQLGKMGLPLALLSIGASLHMHSIRGQWEAVILTAIGKNIILPLITFLLLRTFYPDLPKVVLGVAVIMASLPQAVTSYVIARQTNMGEEFVSACLVVGTILSAITIPAWLYVLL